MSSAGHHRKPSTRVGLPRRSTKGPLDAVDDPLTLSGTPSPSVRSSAPSPLPQSPQTEVDEPLAKVESPQPPPPTSSLSRTSAPSAKSKYEPSTSRPAASPQPTSVNPTNDDPDQGERDLSFLLDTAIYHPLSQVDVPGPFRKPYLSSPTGTTPVSKSLAQLDELLSECEYLRAAHFASLILTSGTVRPTDAKTIFRLLEIRYSCLELCGNLAFAAQEAKALEDISSAFYYDDIPASADTGEQVTDDAKPMPRHVMPFSLRLQALRLQSIGFSDPRRGVSTLYDTAAECREHLLRKSTSPADRALWVQRLNEVSIHVVNALVEMGDLDCAARTLASLKPSKPEDTAVWVARMILLKIRLGDLRAAHSLLESSKLKNDDKAMLATLLAIAEGRDDDAIQALRQTSAQVDPTLSALVRQNLAAAYLYNGEIKKAKLTLEKLMDEGYSFQTLTINLATIYELTSDRARDLKMSLISKVASQQKDGGRTRAFANADFKI